MKYKRIYNCIICNKQVIYEEDNNPKGAKISCGCGSIAVQKENVVDSKIWVEI